MTSTRGSVCWAVLPLVAVVTGLAFWPALGNRFLTWDDHAMFLDNPHYRGLGRAQLAWMLTTFRLGEFMPLTWSSYGLDYLLWGVDPFGYHLTGLALHAAAALVVYALARRLLLAALGSPAREAGPALDGAAALAALVFAVHPLKAEPVGWVSARGTILGGLLFLSSVLAYLRARGGMPDPATARLWFRASLGLYAASLLARSTGVVLPVVLVILDVYPLGRLGGRAGWHGPSVRRVWTEKLPFAALAAAVVPLAILARMGDHGVFSREPYGLLAGTSVASLAVLTYLWRFVVPGAGSPLNEFPPELDPFGLPFLASAAVVALLSVLLVLARRRWPAGLALWLVSLVALAPTSGIVPFGVQVVADRYVYVISAGWATLVGAAALLWWRAWRQGRVAPVTWASSLALAALVLTGLAAASWHRVQMWRDARTLWSHALAYEPRSFIAHLSLGLTLEGEGDWARAADHFRHAVAVAPQHPAPRTGLGRTLTRLGHSREALAHLDAARQLAPRSVEVRLALGGALVAHGRLDDGLAQYRAALEIEPDSATTHFNLAEALAASGRLDEAVDHYAAALRIEPDFVEARERLATARARLDDLRRGRGV